MMLNNFKLSPGLKNLCSFCKKYSIIFLFILLFITQFCVIYFDNHIHDDEAASFVVATAGNVKHNLKKYSFCSVSVKSGTEYNIKDLYDEFFIPENTPKQIIKDLKLIRLQQFDMVHPSLYYTLLRIWEILLPDSDYITMLYWGRLLNLIFFSFAFFFMYKLLNILFKNKTFVFIGLVFAFANLSTLALTTLAREYAMQSMLFVLETYLFVCLYKKQKEENLSYKEVSMYSIATALYLLSGYFAIITAAIYFMILLLKNIRNKHNVILYLLGFILILTVIELLCPNYFLSFYKEYTMNNLSKIYTQKPLIFYLQFCINHLKKYLFYPISFLLALFIFLINIVKNRGIEYNKDTRLCTLLISINFLCIYVQAMHSFFFMARYILPLFPILSMMYLLFLLNQKRALQIVVMLIFVVISSCNIQYGYCDYDKHSIDDCPNYTPNIPIVLTGQSYHILTYIFLHSSNSNTIVFYRWLSPYGYNYPMYYLNAAPNMFKYDKNVSKVQEFLDSCMYFVDNTKR